MVTDGGEGKTSGVIFDFGAPCLPDGLASQEGSSYAPYARPTITPAAAPSVTPLARPADLLASEDVVEVYCESLNRHQPLLYKCGYHLYAALAKHDAWFHGGACLILALGRGFLVRLPRAEAWRVATLEGTTLNVGGHKMPIGQIVLSELRPATTLYAPLVMFDQTIRDPGGPKHGRKICKTGDSLALGVGQALARLGIHGADLKCEAELKRLDVSRGKAMHGVGVTLSNLQAADSLTVQRGGIGAKGRMGGGVFIPMEAP